jgi:hypothetical protein
MRGRSREYRLPRIGRALRWMGWIAGWLVVASAARAAIYEDAATCRLEIAAADLAALAGDPRLMLKAYPAGGERLAWRVRVVAASGRDGLRALSRAIAFANNAQEIAIGEGLARAAAACDFQDGAVTTRIADAVRAAGDGEVTRAFTRYLLNAANVEPDQLPTPPAALRVIPPLGGAIADARHYFATQGGAELTAPSR